MVVADRGYLKGKDVSMRLIFGAIALAAAVVIVGCSAATLFAAAYTSMSASWAALMAGVGIAAVVAWEATAALLIGNCFRTGHYAIGMGAMLLLVLAMCLTFRYELRRPRGRARTARGCGGAERGDAQRVGQGPRAAGCAV